MTANPDNWWVGNAWVPAALIAGTLAVVGVIWRFGARMELQYGLE
jgi:hypothetical protein